MFNHLSAFPKHQLSRSYGKLTSAGLYFPPFGYKGADILIPVALPRGNMSFMLIQVKNRQGNELTTGLRDETREGLKFAAFLLDKKIRHVALMMSFRASQATDKVEIVEPRENTPAPTTRKRRVQASSRFLWESQKRILVATVGFSLQNFPGIGFGNNAETETQTVGVVELLKSPRRGQPPGERHVFRASFDAATGVWSKRGGRWSKNLMLVSYPDSKKSQDHFKVHILFRSFKTLVILISVPNPRVAAVIDCGWYPYSIARTEEIATREL